MIIKDIVIKNFRSYYGENKFTFSNGLTLILGANETDGKTLLLARPSVMTENGEEAKILIGDRVPVTVESVQDGISRTSVSGNVL